MLIPLSVDVKMRRFPVGNMALIAACVGAHFMVVTDRLSEADLSRMILDGWSPTGMVLHQFLHAGWIHLIGNMIYLWIFGNAVCGNLKFRLYVPLFVLFGVIAAVFHNVFTGGPALGASGAVNGIIGFYFVVFPTRDIKCLFWFFIWVRKIAVAGFWLIILWFAFDIWLALAGVGGVAYWAHVGGFVSGMIFGFIAVKLRLVPTGSIGQPTLLGPGGGRK